MIQMTKLRAAVIGCGRVARVAHIRWYLLNPQVDLVAIADPDKRNLTYCAEKYSVRRTYTDAFEMLEKEELDLVSVCSPPHVHSEHVIGAAEAGVNVLCEKPMAPSLEECDSMIRAAKKRSVKLMVGFHKRRNVGLTKVKQLIEAGEIGEPHCAVVHWTCFPYPKWENFRVKLFTGGGVFQDHGSHYADVFRWWLGDIETVTGEMRIVLPETREVEDQAAAVLGFADGAMGTIETSWAGPHSDSGDLIEKGCVYGTRGAVRFSVPPWTHYQAPDIAVWKRETRKWTSIPLRVDMLDLSHYHYKRQIDDFVKCVKEDTQPKPMGEDGRAAIEVVLALYQSWYSGKRIKLPLEKTPPLKEIFLKLRES